MTNMNQTRAGASFRSDINGLRAWAVVAVVLFHFGVPGFTGGFVGVDVFFVISGFLMTGIVVSGLDATQGRREGFSLPQFYLARAKRILPALVILCAVLLAVGWFALAAPDYRNLGGHSVFSLTFLSNVQFWREAGYFDAASHEKWLLHTWSLSVEWQFYLLLPLFLLLVWRLFPGRRNAAYALLALFGVSLLLSIVMTPVKPSAAFYLLPTRAWEMLAGGLVFLWAEKWAISPRAKVLAEWLGFALISASIFLLDASAAWPGYLALLPVVGTVLVLVAARQTSWLVNSHVCQSIGKWSYSVYLWHWPIVVGLVYLELQDQPVATLAGIGLSIALGCLSYRFVENPARHLLHLLSIRSAIAVMALFTLSVALPGSYIRLAHGVPGRLAPNVELAAQEAFNVNQRRANCHLMSGDNFVSCIYGGPNIKAILVGDSHASSVVTALQAALPSKQDGVLAFSYTSCPTLFGVHKERQDLKCAEFNEWVVGQIKNLPVDVPLVTVSRISSAAFGSQDPTDPKYNKPGVFFTKPYTQPSPDFLAEFKENLVSSACRLADTRPVYLVRPFPEMRVNVPTTLSRQLLLGKKAEVSITLADYHQRHAFIWAAQDAAVRRCGLRILNPVPLLCPDGRCEGSLNARPLYYDDHHLSEYGNRFVVPMFGQIFLANSED